MKVRDRDESASYGSPPGLATLRVDGFDLDATLHSGQAFQWTRAEAGGFWAGAIGEVPVRIAQPAPGVIEVNAAAAPSAHAYFGLDDDLSAIRASFPPDDEFIRRAVDFAPGLRILRQPSWECLATFITSSLKQVAHIRSISLELRDRYGRDLGTMAGVPLRAYPAPEALAEAGEAALRECGMGYRAKALHLAASRIASGEVSLEQLAAIEDGDALRDGLCDFYGVGRKIANCVMLFGFARMDAFPVDVWIERILRRGYPRRIRRKASLEDIERFARRHFGPWSGYAQQFLYHYARTGDGAD